MKAIIKYGDLPEEVDLCEIDEPVCSAQDIKIEVKACAICMTDVHIIAGSYPWEKGKVLGHEFCGVVTEKGEQVTKWNIGDRVVACMDGGFARFVVKQEDDWVFPLPAEISFEEGALLEPLSAAANSVWNRATLGPESLILIEGPGTIGLFVLQLCQLAGAKVMITGTDKDAERLNLARRLGAELAVNICKDQISDHALNFTGGKGFDVVFECSGAQAALEHGLSLLRYGGDLIQLGVFSHPATVDLANLVYQNLRIVGSIAYNRDSWYRVIELVRNQQINIREFISAVLPMEKWKDGFERTIKGQGCRTILIP